MLKGADGPPSATPAIKFTELIQGRRCCPRFAVRLFPSYRPHTEAIGRASCRDRESGAMPLGACKNVQMGWSILSGAGAPAILDDTASVSEDWRLECSKEPTARRQQPPRLNSPS